MEWRTPTYVPRGLKKDDIQLQPVSNCHKISTNKKLVELATLFVIKEA